MNNHNSVTGQSLNDQIVCAYACPAQDYINRPFDIPKTIIDWTNSETPEKKDINYYKNEFISLFKEMEEKLAEIYMNENRLSIYNEDIGEVELIASLDIKRAYQCGANAVLKELDLYCKEHTCI